MSNHYSPQAFFRKAPNKLLGQYFATKGLLKEIEFEELAETNIAPIYKQWNAIDDDTRRLLEQDFQAINDMATEGGSRAILDEAKYHNEDLTEQFNEMSDFYDHAFWTFLEKPQFWKGAEAFHHADGLSNSYWCKYKNIPPVPADVSAEAITKLEKTLGQYFLSTQARGKNCKVECYKRDNLDYFFAFPEDYAKANIEWEKQELKRQSHRPAFEIIFVYSADEGKLDIYIPGNKKIIPDLHRIFCNCILDIDMAGDNKKDTKIYDLNPLKSPNFPFRYEASTGIISVTVNRMRAFVSGGEQKQVIMLETDSATERLALYDLLDEVGGGIDIDRFFIVSVGIKVKITNPQTGRPKTITFNVGYPNTCNLKHDNLSKIIRKLLVDSDLEPKPPKVDETI